eukprot:2436624-Amphidinium_carterae.1
MCTCYGLDFAWEKKLKIATFCKTVLAVSEAAFAARAASSALHWLEICCPICKHAYEGKAYLDPETANESKSRANYCSLLQHESFLPKTFFLLRIGVFFMGMPWLEIVRARPDSHIPILVT